MPCSLSQAVDALERLAPLGLAEDWDNVGLLVDHAKPRRIRRCLLTIDLTDAVLDEAIQGGHELIVSYHPPIFSPLRRLRADTPGEARILRAIRAGIAVHAPHTALDAAQGGVNDWLADGLGPQRARECLAAIPSLESAGSYRLEARLPRAAAEELVAQLAASGYAAAIEEHDASGIVRLTFDGDGPRRLIGALPPEQRAHCEIVRREPAFAPTAGQGRGVTLRQPARLAQIARRIKKHLGLAQLRIATARRHAAGAPIERVLLCAGAGASALAPRPADLYWTGEMRHHDVLAALDRGTSVILSEHTHTERGYLPVLRERLDAELDGEVLIDVSRADVEPLRTC
jgi:dinuclear metal center YbgI/SA1388 family protein